MKRFFNKKNTGLSIFLPIILFFCLLAGVVFYVSQKISHEMSESAIQNLSESLDLIQCTIEAILNNEAEFQTLVAQNLALADDPEEFIRAYEKNQSMVKLSLILTGQPQGVSNTGDVFTAEELDFSAGKLVNGLPISQSYLNYMGTWAYTMKCPVVKDDQEIGTLYAEYIYDYFDNSLPDGFYNQQAMLYMMDAKSQRFVLKPKGMGMRNAGHLNLTDFYRANNIESADIHDEVDDCLTQGRNILFYHDVRGERALNYMWSVNDGSVFLVGYVPVAAILQEGRTVNQNIFIVVMVMLAAFSLCCALFYFNQRQQNKLRRERNAERDLYNEQLAQALQAAQIANNSKTTFLSNMSHDIRTPMNAVLGFTTLLAMDADDPVKVRAYTQKITASGEHLLSLINDILDVSKIESGKVVLNFEPFALSDVLASVDAIIQPMAAAKNQTFHVDVTGLRHELLLGDETRINQVLLNLLSNAVKYTPEGGNIWLRICGLKQRSSQYEHIRIEVQDDGYGMTPAFLETIFDAFTRAENSTTNKVQGTGLGMAITKNIIELMGGTIEVFSEVDKGSLFRVELELRIPEGQTNQQFWTDAGIRRLLTVGGEEVRHSVQALLEETGVAVDAASEPESAIELLKHSVDYQVLLLDGSIPGLDLDEAARALQKLLPDGTPILLLTDHDKLLSEADLPPQLAGVLPKPFFVSSLQEKLRSLRAGPNAPAAQEPAPADSLEGMRFLAAEDNEINAEILLEILKLEGAACEIAENGQLAAERFEQSAPGEFDAILMDVQMPIMNGYEATRTIRALPREDAARIPIIAMTANAFAEDEKAALDAGMNAHVAKPIDMSLLKKVILHYAAMHKEGIDLCM